MIVECVESDCFELTERASCLCDKCEAKINMQNGVIGLFLKLLNQRKPQIGSHV